MSSQLRETDVLENIVPQLEAEGYEVYSHPSANLLPSFMQSYRPDAIALREDKKLAIEVVRKGSSTEGRLDKLRELLAGRRDWELRVYWISPSNTPEPIDLASGKEIEQSIKAVEQLASEGLHGAALLMAWATLEALGRALLPEKLARPQTAGRLVEALAGEGYVTPTEADRLRELGKVRNQLAHGGLRAKTTSKDIKSFAATLRTLLHLL
jgi:REase_AHJR-like protein